MELITVLKSVATIVSVVSTLLIIRLETAHRFYGFVFWIVSFLLWSASAFLKEDWFSLCFYIILLFIGFIGCKNNSIYRSTNNSW